MKITQKNYNFCNLGTVSLSLIHLKVANLAGELGTSCSVRRIGRDGGIQVRGTCVIWGCDFTCLRREEGSV